MSFPTPGRFRSAVGFLVILAGLVVAGCATKNPYPVGTFDRAVFYQEQGDLQQAADAYGVFIRQSPTDSLAAEAQYRKAMCYMKIGEYPLAAVELQILQKDYPVSDLVEDAMYQEGVAYLEQVGRVERDISGAREARAHFLRFLRLYPGSQYAEAVRGHLQQIADLVVEKRLRAANVYRQLGRWYAVAQTLDNLLAEEPGSTLTDRVLWERLEAAQHLEETDVAERMGQRLLTEYPDSLYTPRARRALEQIGAAEEAAGE